MSTILLLRLIFAHLLADFALQSDRMCEKKSHRGRKGILFLLLHSFIHAVLAYLFVAQWEIWQIPLVIFFTHLGMDWFKATHMKKDMPSFLIDQSVHLFIILMLWVVFLVDISSLTETLVGWNVSKVWLVAISYLLVLHPSSLLLGMFIKRWTPNEIENKGLPKAGKWIGYLERILILTFVLMGNMESVGFLLAAKSIFRFGELNKAQEIRTTEYVLIGTLASFTIAILMGLVVKGLCFK